MPVGCISLCGPEIRGNVMIYIKEFLDTYFVPSVTDYVDRSDGGIAADVCNCSHAVTVNGTVLYITRLVAGEWKLKNHDWKGDY